MSAIHELLTVMARLRDPETGCPWDVRQTYATIIPHTLEEAYELADAIERGESDDIRDELGDLLLQVVFLARIAEEDGRFDFDAVAAGIRDKLIRRHPHVFADEAPSSEAEQRHRWEAIKAEERAAREPAAPADRPPSVLDNVPLNLPALTRSRKLQSKAARVGFDWPESSQVVGKIREELAELEEAMDHQPRDQAHVAEEVGDLLLACVNLARKLDVDPEQALRAGNAKFERRFRGLEAVLKETDETPESVNFDRLEAAYQSAKARDSQA